MAFGYILTILSPPPPKKSGLIILQYRLTISLVLIYFLNHFYLPDWVMNGKHTSLVLINYEKPLYLWKAYIIRYCCSLSSIAVFPLVTWKLFLFIAVKSLCCLSLKAEVDGQKITWLTPHALQQVMPDDVDFNVMLNFLEVYEVRFLWLLCFVFLYLLFMS